MKSLFFSAAFIVFISCSVLGLLWFDGYIQSAVDAERLRNEKRIIELIGVAYEMGRNDIVLEAVK